MKQLASIHLLFNQRRTYFYMGVLGWCSHMLLSYCLFTLSRLGAAQYLALRLRCNWYASTLAAFIVGLQRFALLGSVHRFVFRWWKAATHVFLFVTYLPVRECDSSSKILLERKMNSILPSVCCPVTLFVFENLTMTIMTLLFWIDISMNNLFYNVLYHSWIFWTTIIVSSILFYISIN